MILPASVPMDDGAVKSELTRYLLDQWEPIISQDIDGPTHPLASVGTPRRMPERASGQYL